MRRLIALCFIAIGLVGCGGGSGSGGASAGPAEQEGTLGNFTFRAAATNPPVTSTSAQVAATGVKGVFSFIRLRDRAGSLDETRIFFSGQVMSTDSEIYSVNVGQDHVTRLTTNPAEDMGPAISPGGTKIAFSSNRDGNYELYTMNVDGTGLTRMTNTPSAFEQRPAWSPDGNKIVFQRGIAGATYLVIIDAFTKAEAPLTLANAFDIHPSYSPDGKKIVFSSTRNANGNWNLFTIPSTGGSPSPLTLPVAEDHYSPSYSPDGTQILFVAGTTVYRMPAVFDAIRVPVTTSAGSVDRPAWSPDGQQILATVFVSPYFRIRRFTLNGSLIEEIVDRGTGTDISQPSWGPLTIERTFITSSGGMLGTRAAGFIYTQSEASTRSFVAFDCTTPTSAVLNQLTGLNASSPNLIFSVDGDAITYLTYTNAVDWKPQRMIGTPQLPSATGALVSFSSSTGELVAVVPFSGSRSVGRPVVTDEGGRNVMRGSFLGVLDATGKNLAPNGASEVSIGAGGEIGIKR